MAWAYILRSASGRCYIGSTTDLQRRIEQHRSGHTHTTRRMGELEILAALELPTLEEARELEREMKRKKNPKLALYLLKQREMEIGRAAPNAFGVGQGFEGRNAEFYGLVAQSVEQPRTLSGLVRGSRAEMQNFMGW